MSRASRSVCVDWGLSRERSMLTELKRKELCVCSGRHTPCAKRLALLYCPITAQSMNRASPWFERHWAKERLRLPGKRDTLWQSGKPSFTLSTMPRSDQGAAKEYSSFCIQRHRRFPSGSHAMPLGSSVPPSVHIGSG